jgi:hypothetical protein
MESAFRTLLSAAGVIAACYVLQTASWIQVLLLFSAGCLGWCVYACKPADRKISPPLAFRQESTPALIEQVREPQGKPETAQPAVQSAPATYRFPIHKLSAGSFVIEPGI